MYETEVNNSTEAIETLPLDIRKCFAEFRGRIAARTTLPWGEHCTECMWPTCYTTCELYEPRTDKACRQFIGSAVRIDHKEGLNPYILKIRFKQWAKLWTLGSLHLQSLADAGKKERNNIVVGSIARALPLPQFAKIKVLGKINYLRKTEEQNAATDGALPDYFLLECFNPNDRAIVLTFSVRVQGLDGPRSFEDSIQLTPGYTRSTIAYSRIARVVDLSQGFQVEIVPNHCENTTLYFGLMDFVKESPQVNGSRPSVNADTKADVKPIKCIVWDLDNTLWDGILVEDGPEHIKVRPGVVDIIKETDGRGILHSIASKNNHDEAVEVLRKHGLDEYFLYPQIGWQAKSQSIAKIAQLLNIGTGSLAFVDDQVFEREEVASLHPEVTTIDAAEYEVIAQRPECQAPITDESRARRQMYRTQLKREADLDAHHGDYFGFLRACEMEIHIWHLSDENLRRVYELAQRTNQMNFSGSRYKEDQLREIMASRNLETCVISCNDRFGEYGIVGFAVIDLEKPALIDLMFSCRVQSKRVEHAVLTFLLQRFVTAEGNDFYANYRRTDRNAPSGKVFEEMGFESLSENDGVSLLIFRRQQQILDDNIVKVFAQG